MKDLFAVQNEHRVDVKTDSVEKNYEVQVREVEWEERSVLETNLPRLEFKNNMEGKPVWRELKVTNKPEDGSNELILRTIAVPGISRHDYYAKLE
jgi:hypothetical protein